jgi:hypothetical protein
LLTYRKSSYNDYREDAHRYTSLLPSLLSYSPLLVCTGYTACNVDLRHETPISEGLKKSLYGRKIHGIEVLPERVALAIVYFGVNIGVSVWDIDWHHYTTFANRLGW